MYTHIQVNMKKIIYGRLNIDIKIYIFGFYIYICIYMSIDQHTCNEERDIFSAGKDLR